MSSTQTDTPTDRLHAALRTLHPGRKARRLRTLWPSIEEKLAEGVTHREILSLLNDHGLSLSARTYQSYVYRLRKQRRAPRSSVVAAVARESASVQPVSIPIASAREGGVSPARPASFEFDPHGLAPELLK